MTDQNVHPESDRWGDWSWLVPARGEHFRRCSFCGSVHPEDLAAEPTWNANWADRKYGWPHKFYVDIPNREPDRLFVVSVTWSPTPSSASIPSSPWVAVADLTPEQRAAAELTGSLEPTPGGLPVTFLAFGTHEHHFGKFYTIHLSDEELSADVKRLVEQRSGLAFEFADGRVTWKAAL